MSSHAGLSTRPERKQRVHIFMYRTAPSCMVRTRCRLGYHLLFVLLLAWLTLWPVRGRLPHIWQTLAICSYLQLQWAVYNSCSLAILQPKKWEDCLFFQQSRYLTHLVPFDKGKTKFFHRIIISHIYNLPHAPCSMPTPIRNPKSEISLHSITTVGSFSSRPCMVPM